MRKLFGSLVSIMILANQATGIVPSAVADVAQAPAHATSTYTLQFNITTSTGFVVTSKQPGFDTAVRQKLIAAQTQRARVEAEKAKTQAAIKAATPAAQPVVKVATGDVWEQLRLCEAGGNYARNSGNGYYGAYQFDISTWGGYGGYARADLAPPTVQDAKARTTQTARGWYPWPACARKLGLI